MDVIFYLNSEKNDLENEQIITVSASAVTNGTGGGAIIEGQYGVYQCHPSMCYPTK